MTDCQSIEILDDRAELLDSYEVFEEGEQRVGEAADGDVIDAPLSSKDRLARLLADVQGLKPVFVGTIEFCRSKRRPAEVDECYEDLTEYNFCNFSPVRMRALLEEAGALCYIEDEGAVADQAGRSVTADADAPLADEQDAEGDYYEIAVRPEGWWQATEEGLAVIDSVDPVGDALQMIGAEPEYEGAYRLLLQALAEGGKSLDALQESIEGDAAIASGRRYVSALIKRLEENAIVEFKGTWRLLPAGYDLLAGMIEAGARDE